MTRAFKKIISDSIISVFIWVFNKELFRYFSELPLVNIIQIGAHDGQRVDPVHPIIKKFKVKAILVEPMVKPFASLRKIYGSFEGIELLKVAVTETNNEGEKDFYFLKEKPGIPFFERYTLWSSFDRAHLEKFKWNVPGFEELLMCDKVETIGINDLIKKSGFTELHYLQIDVEGYDLNLVAAVNFQTLKPYMIRFEYIYSNRDQLKLFMQRASEYYEFYKVDTDLICLSKAISRRFKFSNSIRRINKNWFMPYFRES